MEIASGDIGAGQDGQTHLINPGCGQGTHAAGRRGGSRAMETVVIGLPRQQVEHVDLEGEVTLGASGEAPVMQQIGELGVTGNFPTDLYIALISILRRDSGPDHDPVLKRVATGNTMQKGGLSSLLISSTIAATAEAALQPCGNGDGAHGRQRKTQKVTTSKTRHGTSCTISGVMLADDRCWSFHFHVRLGAMLRSLEFDGVPFAGVVGGRPHAVHGFQAENGGGQLTADMPDCNTQIVRALLDTYLI